MSQINWKLNLHLTANKYSFEYVLDDLLKILNFNGKDILEKDSKEINNSLRKLITHPKKMGAFCHDRYKSFISSEIANDKQIGNLLKNSNFNKLEKKWKKPLLTFGLIVGAIDTKYSKKIFKKIKKVFKVEKKGLKLHPNRKIKRKFLSVYRTMSSEKQIGKDNNYYVTGIDLGKFSFKKYAMAKLLALYIANEGFTALRQKLQICYSIGTVVEIVGKNIWINYVVIGSDIKK